MKLGLYADATSGTVIVKLRNRAQTDIAMSVVFDIIAAFLDEMILR